MTSKEIIQNKINELNISIDVAIKSNYEIMKKCCQYDLKKYNQVLKDLERLEQIDNANPSETLKSLEELRDFRYGEDKLLVCQTEMYSIIKQALLKAQEQDKILRIIKEKNVDIKQLKHFIQCYTKEVSLKTYNDYHSKEELTQEEYDLFEEWLNGR